MRVAYSFSHRQLIAPLTDITARVLGGISSYTSDLNRKLQ